MNIPFRPQLARAYHRILGRISPEALSKRLYRKIIGKPLNLDNPRDLNEWVNFISLRTSHPDWPLFADKYRVREYVASRGLSDMLVQLYGHWTDASSFSLANLPEQFVLKFNGGGDSTSVILVKDRSEYTEEALRSIINNWLTKPFGTGTAEPHYKFIPPVAIAEQLLDAGQQSIRSSSLVDYKIWCIYGEPQYIIAIYNRYNHTYNLQLLDTEWNDLSHLINYNNEIRPAEANVPRPRSLERMLQACRELVPDEPVIRVDFYEVDGKPYFGEITMTPWAGRIFFAKQSWLDEMGARIAAEYHRRNPRKKS